MLGSGDTLGKQEHRVPWKVEAEWIVGGVNGGFEMALTSAGWYGITGRDGKVW